MTQRLQRAAALVILSLAAASCRSPMADAQMVEQMKQLGDELNLLRQDVGELHGTVDSLHVVVARQDTLVRQLANMAGVPVPQR